MIVDLRVKKTEAKYGHLEKGINTTLVAQEAEAATGIKPSYAWMDAADIVFRFDVEDTTRLPDVDDLLAVVQAHDGRHRGVARAIRPDDGAQVVTIAPPFYSGLPRHRSFGFASQNKEYTVFGAKISGDCSIPSGWNVWIGSTATLNDRLIILVTDVDGVEYPPGTIIEKPVPMLHVPAGGTGTNMLRLNAEQTFSVKEGMYFQFKYRRGDSTERATPVDVIAYWTEIHQTAPAGD